MTNPEQQEWPVVHERDDGIRPAGRRDECFYCHQKVGQPHGRDCVVVQKTIRMRVIATLPACDRRSAPEVRTGTWRLTEPHSWTPANSEFHKNEGSWCASNFLFARDSDLAWDGEDPRPEIDFHSGEKGCACGMLRFEFLEVVDPTPRRKVLTKEEWVRANP